jgi:F1F0 ATPase subunit 2
MDAQAMTELHLGEHDLFLLALSAGAWLAVGTLIGAFHFLTLRWNVSMVVAGQSLPLALVTQLVRFAVISGGLAIIAKQFGALPLLVATAGILTTRAAIVRYGVQP